MTARPSPPCRHDPMPVHKIGAGLKPVAIYCRLCGTRLPFESEQARDEVARRLLAQVFGEDGQDNDRN